MKYITSKKISPPNGHYSHAVESNNFIFLSAVLGVDNTGIHPISVEEEFDNTINKIKKILSDISLDLTSIVRITIYVDNIENWEKINSSFTDVFGKHRPARSVVEVNKMHLSARVMVEATATK